MMWCSVVLLIAVLAIGAGRAGGRSCLCSSGTTLASRQTAPATTGDATLVPDRLRQPP